MTKPKKPPTKKLKINGKVYEAIKKKAESAKQSVQEYTETLLNKDGQEKEAKENADSP